MEGMPQKFSQARDECPNFLPSPIPLKLSTSTLPFLGKPDTKVTFRRYTNIAVMTLRKCVFIHLFCLVIVEAYTNNIACS